MSETDNGAVLQVRLTQAEVDAMRAAITPGDAGPVAAWARRAVTAWDHRGEAPPNLQADAPVGDDRGAEGVSPVRLYANKGPNGAVCGAIRAQVIRYPGHDDKRAFIELCLWVPVGKGQAIYSAWGLEGARAAVGVLRAAVRDLERVSPRMP